MSIRDQGDRQRLRRRLRGVLETVRLVSVAMPLRHPCCRLSARVEPPLRDPRLPPSHRHPEGPMNAIPMLEEEHVQMRKLLDRLESTTERGVKTRQELFATIKGELTLHEVIEEEIFYPELKAHPKAVDIVLEGYQEHHVVDLLMAELEGLDVDDESWGAKAKVMKENVEHHMEEEEGDMFKKARQVFDRDELEDLGRRMEQRRMSAGRE